MASDQVRKHHMCRRLLVCTDPNPNPNLNLSCDTIDCTHTGSEVAMAVSQRAPAWVDDGGAARMIPASLSVAANSASHNNKTLVQRFITKPLLRVLQFVAKKAIFYFLHRGFRYGKLTFILPDSGEPVVFQGEKRFDGDDVVINVHNNNFFLRLALEYDLGLSKSYIANEFAVAGTKFNYDGLTKFLLLLTDNTYKPVNKFDKSRFAPSIVYI